MHHNLFKKLKQNFVSIFPVTGTKLNGSFQEISFVDYFKKCNYKTKPIYFP